MTWALLQRIWPYMLWGLVLLGGWYIVNDWKEARERIGTLEAQQQMALAANAQLLEEHQAQEARLAKRERELRRVSREYKDARNKLAQIPQEPCLDAPVHPDADRLLKPADPAPEPAAEPGAPGAP